MRRLLFILLLIAVSSATAQQADTLPGKWMLSARFHYGFIIAHRPTIVHLQHEHVKGAEIEFARPLNGNNDWQQPYQLPLYSISYHYFDLGNAEELGNAHALVPKIIFPFSIKKWMRTSLSVGVGLGYIEKTFDRYENYKNTAIGSHLNSVVSFSYQARIKLSKRIRAVAGITFTHFSNGSIHPPNLGINVPTVNAGLSYFIGAPYLRTIYIPKEFKRTSFSKLVLGGGIKGMELDHGINYYGITAIEYSRNTSITRKSMLNGGADFYYDRTLARKLEKLEKHPVSENVSYRVGLNFGYVLNAGNISMLIKNGFYIYDKYKEDGIHYIVLGVEYHFTPELLAGYYLKSHYGKADFFEYAIGCVF